MTENSNTDITLKNLFSNSQVEVVVIPCDPPSAKIDDAVFKAAFEEERMRRILNSEAVNACTVTFS